MSKNLKNLKNDLEFISKIDCNKTLRVLLNFLFKKKPEYYDAIKEIADNLVKKYITLNNDQNYRLGKHKKIVHKIAKSKKRNKKLFVQSGGWLWVVPVVSAIIDLIK